jgi:hypothetical protein
MGMRTCPVFCLDLELVHGGTRSSGYRHYVLLRINLFIMLDSVLQKASTGVDPHFIDVWVPMHRDDPEAT